MKKTKPNLGLFLSLENESAGKLRVFFIVCFFSYYVFTLSEEIVKLVNQTCHLSSLGRNSIQGEF